MPNYSRSGIAALINDRIEQKIESQTVELHPLINLLGATEADNSPYNSLGRPGMGAVFGSVSMGKAVRESKLASYNRHFRITRFESEAASNVTHGGATPVATTRADENVATFETRMTHVMKPVEFNAHTLERLADSGSRVGMANYVQEMMQEPWERLCKSIHQMFWTDTLTAAQQDLPTWPGFLGLQHTLTASNTYGRTNRATSPGLDPNVIDATADFSTPSITLEMIRKINSGFTRTTAGTKFVGLKHRSGDGRGATCWITTPELWQELADQIESRYVIQIGDLPAHGLGGFKYDALNYQGTYIIADNLCPDGEMYGLCLDSWLLEVDPRHNMRFLGLTNEAATVRGGDYIEWGQLSFQARLTCRRPFANARVTGLTA